jgi:release factor glutamine methyltransferase
VARLRAAGCVFAEEEAALLDAAAASADELDALVERRAGGEPLEHVVGWAAFMGLRVRVEAGVFVPRRRTELLAREAIHLARDAGDRPVVVDLCCGSGAVALAVAAALDGEVVLHAADVDPVAVRCARRNLAGVGEIHRGDLFDALPRSLVGGVDVLVANVPYVPTAEIGLLPAEARVHEPRVALDGGGDGLDVLRRVAAGAPRWLAPGGRLLVELTAAQAPLARRILTDTGLDPRLVTDDELDATVVVGTARTGHATATGQVPRPRPARSRRRPPPD